MRQVRLVIIAGIGILALCGVAVVSSLMDYVSRPGVAVAHVPPVAGPVAAAPAPADTASAPSPMPTTPVTSVPVQQSQDQPAAPAPQQQTVPATMTDRQAQMALAKFLEDLRQHRRPPRQR